ncbi:hypothetical protein EUX98_g8712 [Antrodiella citrinella]|uniref:Uncharacterized protein n=1 Tax=Antrodiella citrinella TaxID=2447956 RepID=A0A4S4M3L8_9APHY|nr:hypothetical protein EUX98_g8712 [Antrodiella citrinella]
MQEWRRNMLDIQDTDHDFTIPTDTSVVLPSGPEDDLMAGDLDVAEEADYMGEDEEEEEEEEL